MGILAAFLVLCWIGLPRLGVLEAAEPSLFETLESFSPYESADHYRAVFLSSETFLEKLQTVPDLAVSFLEEGRVKELPELFCRAAEEGESWQAEAFRAEMFVVFGDLEGEYEARRSALEANPEDLLLIDRLWDLAVALDDLDGVRTFSRELAEKSGDRMHWMDYYRVLIRQDEAQTFLDVLDSNGEDLFSIKQLFPELFRHDALDTIRDLVVDAMQSEGNDWRALITLGKYAVFSGDRDQALGYFQRVVGLNEDASEDSVVNGFPRLNRGHLSRHVATRNLALASGAFGSEGSLEYSFLGVPDRFDPGSLRDARDAALLYWKSIAVEDGSSEAFLNGLAEILEEADFPYGERILAMGIAGAPRYMMAEVDRYLSSGIEDADTDRLILRAVNRYSSSVERFPDLREPMIEATDRITGRLAGDDETQEAQQELFRQRLNMLNRLNQEEDVTRLMEERLADLSGKSDAASLLEQLELAIGMDDYKVAERNFERLTETPEGRETLTESASDWLNLQFAHWHSGKDGDNERAAGYLERYVRSLGERTAGSVDSGFSVRSWWDSDQLPLDNPYWNRDQMGAVFNAIEAFIYDHRFPLLREALHTVALEYPRSERGPFRYLESRLFWWRGDSIAARINLTDGASETNDSFLTFLAAFVAAREQRIEQTRFMLKRIPDDEIDEFQRSALLFLVAVDADDVEGMNRYASELATARVARDEGAPWASIMLDHGFHEEAGKILGAMNPNELGGRLRDDYFRAVLRWFQRVGESEKGAPLARNLLQRELPPGFARIDSPLRREALRVVDAAGQGAAYRLNMKGAMELAPRAFQISLLMGESVPYTGDYENKRSRVDYFQNAAETRVADFHIQFEYAQWLYGNNEYGKSVSVLDRLLHDDAPGVLVHDSQVAGIYEKANALDRLYAFFESWKVPQARSMDEFYGIQPTGHLFDSMGSRFFARGDSDAAIDAWRKGVKINPVGFTEPMRTKLTAALWEEGRMEDYFAVLKDYLFRETPEPELWVVQPFGAVVPRWLSVGRVSEGMVEAPLMNMLEPLKVDDKLAQLRDNAERWRQESLDDLSRQAFYLVVLALAKDGDLESERRNLKEPSRPGPEAAIIDQLDSWLRAISNSNS